MTKTRAARHRDGTNPEKIAPGKYERPPRRDSSAAGVSIKSPRPSAAGSRKKPGQPKGAPKRSWRREDLEAVLDRMRDQQRRLHDVLKDPDLPSLPTWSTFARKHPELLIKVQRVYFSFPYAFQSGLRCISPRLCMDCRRLNARKLRGAEIAKALGIPTSLVAKALLQSEEEIRRMERSLALVDDAPPMYQLPRDIEPIVKAARASPGRTTPWSRGDYDEILRRMREQRRMLKDVCSDEDLPGFNSFRGLAMRRPEYRRKAERIHFSFPYKMQTGLRRMSPQFPVDCHRLRARRLGVGEIARILEVPGYLVSKALRQPAPGDPRTDGAMEDDNGGPPMHRLPDDIEFFVEDAYTTPGRRVQWRREDFRAILERMAEQGRTLSDVCFDIDLPARAVWKGFEKKNPGTAAMVRRIHYTLPYKLQVEAGQISPRFHEDCLRLKARKLDTKEISGLLEAPYRMVLKALHGRKWGMEPMGPVMDHGVEAAPMHRLPRDIHAMVNKVLNARVRCMTTKWREKDFEAMLERMMAQGRTLKDVCGDDDAPSLQTWMLFVRKKPEFAAMAKRILYSFPYSVQCRSYDLSPGFPMDCQRLRNRGLTWKKIGVIMGVSAPTARKAVRSAPEKAPFTAAALPGGLVAPPMYRLPENIDAIVQKAMDRNDPSPQWDPVHYTAILDRMREQRRALGDVCMDPDLPGHYAWKSFVKRRPEFAGKASRIHYALPYSVQHGVRDVSPFFQMDCVRLHKRGLSAERIGKVLGVAPISARRALQSVDPTIDFSEIVLCEEPDEPPIHRLPDDIDAIVKKAMAPKKKELKWRRERFEAILERMRKQQRPLSDVCGDSDLPPYFQWTAYVGKHPGFAEEAGRIHHGMSYQVQIKVRDISPRFRVDCGRLRSKGMKLQTIADMLGVAKHNVARALEGFVVKTEGLPDNWLSRQWGREDFEAILQRMREEGRSLYDVSKDADLPGHFLWRRFVRENPGFEEEARRIEHFHSYPVQIKLKNLSPRFFHDCKRLWATGLSCRIVSEALGTPESSVKRVLNAAGLGEHNRPRPLDNRHWAREDFEAVLDRMRARRRSLGDVCNDPDLPGLHYCRRYAVEHPEFEDDIRRINHSQPYPVQAMIKDLSPRFHRDCKRLRSRGLGCGSIAKALGVSESTVMRKLKEAGLIKPSDPPRSWRDHWDLEDFEAIPERMRIQRRALPDVCRDDDLPSRREWGLFIKEHPGCATTARQIRFSLPYALQFKARDVSPRFRVDCEKLRSVHMSIATIADALGVSNFPVRRVLMEAGLEKQCDPSLAWRERWDRDDFEAILERMRVQRRALPDVCGDVDLPSKEDWTLFIKTRPGCATTARQIHFSLPYAVQIKARDVSPRFRVDCETLRSVSMSMGTIADALGVSFSTVRRVLRKAGLAK